MSSLGFAIFLMAKGGRNGVDMLIREPVVDKSFPTLLPLVTPEAWSVGLDVRVL